MPESFAERRDRYIRQHHLDVFGYGPPDGPIDFKNTHAGVVQRANLDAIGEMLEEVLRRLPDGVD